MTATRSPKEGPAENGNGPGPGAPVGRVGAIEPVPLAPLPTKEETQRAIEEEAAKKQAERIAQVENKDAELRSRRLEEQIKFREELRELLRAKGTRPARISRSSTSATGTRSTPIARSSLSHMAN